MKKWQLALLIIFVIIFSAVSIYVILDVLDLGKSEVTNTAEDSENTDNIEEDLEKDIVWRSPLSGIETTEEIYKTRPVAIMFDNHPKARWQAGLKDAEIIYEFPVENPYTRYIGIFLLNEPKSIGPIRSTRPYLVHTIAGYDPIYVRCGGSEDGKAEVERYDIADIDCLSSSTQAFTRLNTKKAPNNLYISMENIKKEQKKLNYSNYSNYEGYKFNEADTDILGTNGETITIKYNNSNTTKYEYDSTNKIYKRYKDGSLHIDESDKSTITAKNIIIQKAESKILDDDGRKKIDVIGSGKGIYISNGKSKDISWVKPSAKEKTIYSDELGEIHFNEGVTWIQVVQTDTELVIE